MKFTDRCPNWSPSLWMKWPSQTNRASNMQEAEPLNAEVADTSTYLAWLRNLSIDDITRLFECNPAQAAIISALVASGAYNGLAFQSPFFAVIDGWKFGRDKSAIQLSVYSALPFLILSGINQLADIYGVKKLKKSRAIYDAFQDGASAYFFTLLAVLAFTEFFTNDVNSFIFFLLNLFPIFMGLVQLNLGLPELSHLKFLNYSKKCLKKFESSFDALQNGFTLQSFITYFSSVIQTVLHPTLKLIAWVASVLFAIFIPYYLKESRGFNADKIDKVWDFLSGFTYFLGILQIFQENYEAFYYPGIAWAEQGIIVTLVSIVLPLVVFYNLGFPQQKQWWRADDTNDELGTPQDLEANAKPSSSCCEGVIALAGKSITKALNCGRTPNDTAESREEKVNEKNLNDVAESEEEVIPIALSKTSNQRWIPSCCVIS